MRKSKKGGALIALSFILRRNEPQMITAISWTIKPIKTIKHKKQTDNRLLAGESLQSPYTKLLSETYVTFPK